MKASTCSDLAKPLDLAPCASPLRAAAALADARQSTATTSDRDRMAETDMRGRCLRLHTIRATQERSGGWQHCDPQIETWLRDRALGPMRIAAANGSIVG